MPETIQPAKKSGQVWVRTQCECEVTFCAEINHLRRGYVRSSGILRVGGHLFLGVPNVLSLHNRLLGLFGIHPTSSKMISGHVRVFSKSDTTLFYREIAGEVAAIKQFYGSQFYPFPKMIARRLAAVLPSAAFSIFFLIQKTAPYHGEFIERLSRVPLETNFFKGGGVQPAT